MYSGNTLNYTQYAEASYSAMTDCLFYDGDS